uniref:Membrane-spanning 4-domains, subfamily A, member 18 n=1 Tax=Nannospalax galili TaxID=1026970 RepID=A0A8C6RJ01_NANGA
MIKQDSGTNYMSAATVPGNVHIIQPTHAVVSRSQEKPLGVTPYPATVLQCNTETANLHNPHIAIQSPAGVTDMQSQPTGLQYPVGMASVQTPPGVIQYSPGATNVQILSGNPQNPLNTVPGPTQTSGQTQWNMSFVSFPEFNPRKFINEEVRTLGAIQILIGLFHIFSAINPILYETSSVLGISGYPIWGGLSFIISGSLSVSAEKNHNTCMVNGSIGMNIVSSIISLLGIAIIILSLCVYKRASPVLQMSMNAVSGGLLPFALLEFIITCTVSHFGCQAVCWNRFENIVVFSNMFGGNTVNTTGPVNNNTGPATSITTSPANPTFPSDASPKHIYQDAAA